MTRPGGNARLFSPEEEISVKTDGKEDLSAVLAEQNELIAVPDVEHDGIFVTQYAFHHYLAILPYCYGDC